MTTISDMSLVASDDELWGTEAFSLSLFHWSSSFPPSFIHLGFTFWIIEYLSVSL